MLIQCDIFKRLSIYGRDIFQFLFSWSCWICNKQTFIQVLLNEDVLWGWNIVHSSVCPSNIGQWECHSLTDQHGLEPSSCRSTCPACFLHNSESLSVFCVPLLLLIYFHFHCTCGLIRLLNVRNDTDQGWRERAFKVYKPWNRLEMTSEIKQGLNWS